MVFFARASCLASGAPRGSPGFNHARNQRARMRCRDAWLQTWTLHLRSRPFRRRMCAPPPPPKATVLWAVADDALRGRVVLPARALRCILCDAWCSMPSTAALDRDHDAVPHLSVKGTTVQLQASFLPCHASATYTRSSATQIHDNKRSQYMSHVRFEILASGRQRSDEA